MVHLLRACNDVATDKIFEIVGSEMQYRRQGHGVDGGLPENVTCTRVMSQTVTTSAQPLQNELCAQQVEGIAKSEDEVSNQKGRREGEGAPPPTRLISSTIISS